MTLPLLRATTDLVGLRCGTCGIEFAVPDFWLAERKERGAADRSFYCPNGHARVFCETELDRVRRELRDAEAARDWNQRRADKADRELTRLRRRIARGVCPECQRSFQNLRRHMESKHARLALPAPRKANE